MRLPAALLSLSLILLASCVRKAPHPGKSIGIESYPEAKDLYQFAENQRARHNWPALGVGLIHQGKIAGLGMAGERKRGSGAWAALEDQFDVASCAKSMTASVAAMLVEEGKLRWDTKVADIFPEWLSTMAPACRAITLEQLLEHRAGLDQWMNSNARWAAWHQGHPGLTASEQRLLRAQATLQQEPPHPPGSRHVYCNDGYIVAGAMMEKVAGLAFEELMRRRLFEPLNLASLGFGAPAIDGGNSVWGHEARAFGRTAAKRSDPAEYGAPPFGSPAGFLHGSVPDLLRYVEFHIRGANGTGPLLSREAFDRLCSPPPGGSYALGWEVEFTRDPAGKILERSVYHGGYSGRFRANIWFCPESEWGAVIVCNDGRGDGAEMSAVFFALLKEFRLVGEPANN